MPVTVRSPEPAFPGWGRRRQQRLATYLTRLLAAMGLSDWELTLDLEQSPDGEDTYADVGVIYGQLRATLRLSEAFLQADPDIQRATLVHELLHLHLNPLADLSDQALEGAVTPGEQQMHSRVLYHALEEKVDQLATVLAPSMPPFTLDGRLPAASPGRTATLSAVPDAADGA